MKINIKNVILALSITLNIGLLSYMLFWDSFNWNVKPRYGVLKEDVYGGKFHETGHIFMLPKGLSVKDVTPRNKIDLFEPHRFSVTISSDRELVDYHIETPQKFQDLYSADRKK